MRGGVAKKRVKKYELPGIREISTSDIMQNVVAIVNTGYDL